MKKRLTISVLLAVLLSATYFAFPGSGSTNKKFYGKNTSVQVQKDLAGDLELTGGKARVKNTVTLQQKYFPPFSVNALMHFSSLGTKQKPSTTSLQVDAYLSHIYPTHNFW